MRIAVAIVCLNAASTVRQAVLSVVEASEHVAQLIVVDGGSSDGTVGLVREAGAPLGDKMIVMTGPDEGLYDAMNKAIEAVDADYLLFLGADDTVIAAGLAAVHSDAGLAGDAGLIVCDVEVVTDEGLVYLERACERPRTIGTIPRSMPVCHQALLYSVQTLRLLGGFSTAYRIAADYDLYLRFLELDSGVAYVPVPVARFALGGTSSRDATATADEYRRAWVAHGVPPWRARLRMRRSLLNARVASWLRGR